MTDPRVSVITIFLNAERFLGEAVESVLGQTREDWELLLVDDGSTDGSPETARRYAERHPGRIRYLEHPDHANQGMSASRNLGLAHARGEYVALLDADDVYLPEALERRVAELASRPEAGMVYGPTLYWYGWTGDPEDARRDFLDFRGGRGPAPGLLLQPPVALRRWLDDGGSVPCMCGLLARRRTLEAAGGFERRFPGLYEDQAFYAKMALAAPVLVSGECWAKYRRHPGSACSVAERSGDPLKARRTFLEWLAEYLSRQEVREPEVWRSLRRELRLVRHPMLARLRRRVRKIRGAPPRVGTVRFGSLRRLTPVSRAFGFDRGQPVDRHYIEGFLARHAGDVRGRVLEVGDATYTRDFGADRVTRSDVLHVREGHPGATIVSDLSRGENIPSDAFDCVVLTQTLHLIYDVKAALRTVHRILRPGGVLLATAPGISQIDEREWGATWYWSFTPLSLRRLAEEVFRPGEVVVEARGNVLAACAFLQGLAAEELRKEELDHYDPSYPVVVALRAVKGGAA